MKNLLITAILSTFLFACSSAPEAEINYYLLNSPNLIKQPIKSANYQANINIVINEIYLPQYLKQPSLVMLIGLNKLHFSHYNLWGENLTQGIKKSLSQEFVKLHLMDNNNTDKTPTHQVRLSLVIDHFYPTDQSQIILAGHYNLTADQAMSKTKVVKVFKFEQAIEKDGFTQTVIQMRSLLTQLAQQIGKDANLNYPKGS